MENPIRRPSPHMINLGRVLTLEMNQKLTQEDVDDLIKTIVIYNSPEDLDIYLENLKESIASLFDKLLSSLVNMSIQQKQFLLEYSAKEAKPITESKQVSLTINEVCEKMNISRPTYYTWVEKGLKTYSIGGRVYVHQSELDNFIKSQSE
jgi:excisionase family DNA binding protein